MSSTSTSSPTFAGVLCHGVAMHLEEPSSLVTAMGQLAEPGGIVSISVMGWAAATDKEPAGLLLGAPGAVGELRVVGVAPLNVDRDTRATIMAMVGAPRSGTVPVLAPRWRRPVQWVGEGLEAEVRYLERTPTGWYGMLRRGA
jgi:hypothetical protein